ncbi:MAG: Na/Pi symporter [Bacteroidetes bacterium]|nr:Na/Pi symporter [Bacteroidota bacterium]MBU1677666.1 Na/Pi symporter [Bacteroidota bacterium]MBU2508448.1 Na/Pi symporter [Bacteroidota bacterium]
MKKYPNLLATLQLFLFLYLFLLSLQMMGDGFKLFGSSFSKTLIETTSNPFVGLFIGILATSMVQSSSSTTSIVVGMVAGGALSTDTEVAIRLAIPIIMGANIGTSITNTLASLPQINRSNEFKRAFAAATVHDFFNFLSVIILFPLQLATNFLGVSASYLGEIFVGIGGLELLSPVKAMTKPISKYLVGLIENLAGGAEIYKWIVIIISILLLFIALKYMVSALKILVVSKAKAWFDEYLFKTAVRAFIVGILLTVLVQSSSITTSLIVPLTGAGLLTLTQIFPYTLGSNIGTTITAILAALVTGNLAAVIVAFAHLLFNISGIIIWWPFKFVPIALAEKFAEYSIKNKFIPIAYIVITFFIIPITVIYIYN